ncbi:cobalamin biosynthesis protein CobN [Methanobacterium sp. MZ-A1]|uniref:Cobaltochelatase subunit CobN n=1 Tax=Methanobacterium subterraneum TaxID=59277 RepID=A0A7K4DKH9_9EURY|nr:cobalamin biosynthesis protein CobN [Methanobacterium sp. MZ-A1]MBW4257046.1 cobaltochelatase subunit CobN [Methanobacterium sp. YSL]NMO08920.1 cobaltochelatase subunit CobN [Methanobacterium subterraneum]
MRKQAILLVTTIVFALLLSGAVSAEDSQGGDVGNNTLNSSDYNGDALVDPEITLNVTLEHPEALSENRLPTVNVTDNNGNTIQGVTVTSSGNSIYKVNFLSDGTNFNLNVSAWGHVAQSVNVQVFRRNLDDPTLYGEANVTLRAYNLLIISSSETFVQNFVDSYKKLKNEGYYFNLYYFGLDEVTDTEKQEKIREAANKADLIALQMISSSSKVDIIKDLISASSAQKILGIRSSNLNIPGIDLNDTVTKNYWAQGGEENVRRFQLYLLNSVGMELKTGENVDVVKWPDQMVYHPNATSSDVSMIGGLPLFKTWDEYFTWYKNKGLYKENAPWIAIVAYDSSLKGGNFEMQVELLKSLEAKGANVMLIFATTAGRLNLASMFFKDANNNTRIDALIASLGFTYVSGNSSKSILLFEDLNVPIFAPVYTSDLEGWEDSSTGITSEVYWQIAQPELEGRIEPVIMGGIETVGIDSETGIVVKRYKAIPDRIERVTGRVMNWVELRNLENSAKKLALIYYNIGGGKDGVSASYLDVVSSIDNIIKSLNSAGYNVPANFSSQDIVNLMLNAGNNVGSWAPGELEKLVNAGAITIPLETYLAWFNTLPETLRNEVIAEWGHAPGNVMVYNNSIVIPGIMLGNLFLGPQPMRGWGEDPDKITHSPSLPPTHQYIAFYMWLQNQFDANAVIHLGTHGTLEWLPGRSVGLGIDDWPDVLLGNIPNIYPYIVENPGEGTQAKRRSYAVIIDHMIPPMVLSELYGDLASLSDQIKFYHDATTDQRRQELENIMVGMIKDMHLDEDLQLDLESTPFNEVVDKVEHYLEELAKTMMPYGLHTFGQALEGDLLEQMIESIVSFDPVNRDNQTYRDELRLKLSQNYEMENLLRALNGEYISASLAGSPIRKTDVIPTGMNFYSFDPRYAPDKASWEIGKKMADDLLQDFYNANGHYPESVGVVLWAIETMRTNGQTIAMILRLMGLEPTYASSGYFNGVKATPLSELNRPRVDVMVSMSGLFRDTFSYTVELLDDAFRMVSKLDESNTDNYVRKHYLEDLEKYLAQGMDVEDAELYAMARIFGPPAEAYGTGLSELTTTTSGWDDLSDLVDTYLARNSYFYGRNINAKSGLNAFINQLTRIEATVQVRDGLYGVFDNDDVVQYLGGLTMAAKYLSGRDVQVYIANTRTTPKVETLSTFINNEIRTRLLNPKWAEGMLKNGFSGAHEITDHMENMFRWNAIQPDSVKEWMWQSTVETYMFDSAIRSQFLSANPYAFASAAAWALEAIRRGMWTPDAATTTQLKDIYMNAIHEYGVVCCHHTCGNVDFTNFVVVGSSLSSEQLQEFAAIMEAATGEPVTLGSTGTPSQPTASASSSGASSSVGGSSGGEPATESGTQSASESQSSSDESAGTDGSSKSYEVSETSSSSPQSSMPIAAIVGVLILVGLVGFGYFRGAIFKR